MSARLNNLIGAVAGSLLLAAPVVAWFMSGPV